MRVRLMILILTSLLVMTACDPSEIPVVVPLTPEQIKSIEFSIGCIFGRPC